MGKLLTHLEKQLQTEYKQDAEDCMKIYNYLLSTTGHVWSSNWTPLVRTIYKGFPSDHRRFEPTSVGRVFLKGLLTD